MKKFRVKSFLWILLPVLILGWYGECFTREESCCIDDPSVAIENSLIDVSTGQEHQGSTFVDKYSTSHSGGHFSKIGVAEIEEVEDRLNLMFVKKKLVSDVSFYIPFLAADLSNCLATIKDIVPCLRDSSISILERYLIFRVLRI